MLSECFVETRESRIADFSLERLTENVLGNIDPTERDVGEGLREIVDNAVAGEAGQTVFIVGPSGAGKSTFLERFFIRTLAPDVRNRCIVVKIDVLDASGDESVAIQWITDRAIGSIEQQLFEDGNPTWNELQALYHLEYKRRATGTDAALYGRSKDLFKEKFACYVEEQVEKDREGYLRRLLSDIVKNRKKLPVFVIDNTDEFALSFKILLFQYLQALRREVDHCLLIFPSTDRSAWTFSKTEIFNIYSSKSFFLPTPPPREVFRKRIDYIKSHADESETNKQKVEYIAKRGIRISIKNLAAFASVIEQIFVNQDYASKQVGELSNYNMRKALILAKRVITSSVLNLEDLVRSYLTGTLVAPSPMHFSNALIKGDYRFYKVGDEPMIFPLYHVDNHIRQSPLMNARVLVLLNERSRSSSADADRYMSVDSILAYFGVMAVPEVSTQRSLEALLLAGLIEPYDLSKKDYADDQRLAITYSGSAQLNLGVYNPVFFEQFALTTPIADPESASQIKSSYSGGGPLPARLEAVREAFAAYLVSEDKLHCITPERPEFRAQSELVDEILSRWSMRKSNSDELWKLPDTVAEGIDGIIENFDHFKGFGFVQLPSLHDDAFLHTRIVEQANLPDVHDGDRIVCDVVRNEKGLVVSRLISVLPSDGTRTKGTIVKLVPDRRFGFLRVPTLGVDAFFHFHLFSPERQGDLSLEQELDVEVKADDSGRYQVRRVL